MSAKHRFSFSVDAALLRELGERLVGQPHIAVAELVKNSFDADATCVTVHIDVAEDQIVIADDGVGMTVSDVERHFMRVGTTHKVAQSRSHVYERPLTGSKGVGRLSTQFLASELLLETRPRPGVADRDAELPGLVGIIEWDTAGQAGDLTEVVVDYEEIVSLEDLPNTARTGTRLKLSKLRHTWDTKALEDLASAIWHLRGPFAEHRPVVQTSGRGRASDPGMEIRFSSSDKSVEDKFVERLEAIRDIWHARLRGEWVNGVAQYRLDLSDGSSKTINDLILAEAKECHLGAASLDVRIYHLVRRQPKGIKVGDARAYLEQWGGVQVIDAGFRLPYYGSRKNDWLQLERIHAARRVKPTLLPVDLHTKTRMLNYLPTTTRMLGHVHVNSGFESRRCYDENKRLGLRKPAERLQPLTIQVSRDRFVQGPAIEKLQDFVLLGLEWYAATEAKRSQEEGELRKKVAKSTPEAIKLAREMLHTRRAEVPVDVADTVAAALAQAETHIEAEEEQRKHELGLMAALATAGMAALAYRHELSKLMVAIRASLSDLERKVRDGGGAPQTEFGSLAIRSHIQRVEQISELFSFVSERENRESRVRFKVRRVVDSAIQHLSFMAPDALQYDLNGLPEQLRLPPGSLAEWHSVFQNVLTNAFNAMLDVQQRRLMVTGTLSGRRREVRVEDTGVGIDISTAEELFQPFVRKAPLSKWRQRRGYGGSGLGLTIVRVLADELEVRVSFVPPHPGFSAALQIAWEEVD